MKRVVFLTSLVSVLLLLALGCSDKATEPSNVVAALDVDEEFGGYDAIIEIPWFGDSELLVEEDEEDVVEDPLALSAEVNALLNDPASGIFRLRAVWGQLRLDTTVTDATNWSGSLEISRGGILIRRIIRFEPGQDYVIPRVDRKLLEWHSVTTVHNDGIAVDLIVPQLFPTVDTTYVIEVDDKGDTVEVAIIDTIAPNVDPVEVSFRTGPYSRIFTLGELARLDTVVILEDSNQIAFSGYQFSRCPRGVLTGRWGRDEEGQGVFRGMWISQAGHVTGWLKGHYDVSSEGKRVFSGKWIDREGRFQGFLRGTWHPSYCPEMSNWAVANAAGRFEGRIFSANRLEIGVLSGVYKSCRHLTGGFFQGRWKLHCPRGLPGENFRNSGIYSDGL